jgi:hypothetical protein
VIITSTSGHVNEIVESSDSNTADDVVYKWEDSVTVVAITDEAKQHLHNQVPEPQTAI